MSKKNTMKQLWIVMLTLGVLSGMTGVLPQAQASHRYHQRYNHHYDNRREPLVDYKTGKILKGSLVGAGIGAGTGLLLEQNVGRNALIGVGLGAGTQALRYSSTMRRHPIMKTAGYGALTGIGVSALSRHGNLGTGALVGGGLGAGLGALQHGD